MNSMKLFVAVAFMAISSSSFAQKAYDPTADKALQKQIADQIKVEKARLNLLKTHLKTDKDNITIQNQVNDCNAVIRQLGENEKVVKDAIKTQGDCAKQIENYNKLAEKAAKAKDEALKANEKAEEAIRKAEEMRQKAANKAEQAKADADNMKFKHDNAQQTAAETKAKVNEIRESLKK